jgi:hypothetical protein
MRSKTLSAAALLLLASACSAAGTNQTVPTGNAGSGIADVNNVGQVSDAVQPDADATSVLKLLTTQTTIGSTVDPSNGDTIPSGITYASKPPYGGGKLKKGDLVVCNYANKAGAMGQGTTEELLTTKPGSKPTTLVTSKSILGCASLGIQPESASVYSADATAKNVGQVLPNGKVFDTITSGMTQPYGSVYAPESIGYPPGDAFFVGDAGSGKVLRLDLGTSQRKPPVTDIINGFKVNKGKPGSVLGPTALAYMAGPQDSIDILYVVDGANNIIYAFKHAYQFMDSPNRITIGADGKSFTGPDAQDASVFFSGKPLNAPISATILKNGNLIVANSVGNTLVEIESTGKLLATKVVDKGAAGAIRGIIALGASDPATQLFFTDANGNNVQELSK